MPPDHPLAEVFGWPCNNMSGVAKEHRMSKLCPFHNRVPECTKNSVIDPLGVCSMFDPTGVAIICPVRFRQNWQIAADCASFFFPGERNWNFVTEARMVDAYGQPAGNVDIVIIKHDGSGEVLDFGMVEVQAVYISGNIRLPFDHYMEAPENRCNMNWHGQRNYPRADYLSSSRKRLVPQLAYKGGIMAAWQKKMAVVLQTPFLHTMPELPEVDRNNANLAWFVYDLLPAKDQENYRLTLQRTIYTEFAAALAKLTNPEIGSPDVFRATLQAKLRRKLSQRST